VLNGAIGRAFLDACELDLTALKPGNVGLHGAGHGMDCEVFRASARVAAGPLAAPAASVGRRILGAVEATRATVACNTNLGIVLLSAPLIHAALGALPGEALPAALARTLATLDVADARLAYAAIRLANPGGLGESARHDVHDEPDASLLAAMVEARERDAIAAQYANGYRDVLDLGLPLMRRCQARWGSEAWAASAVYLEFASRLPDSHVARKHGLAAAQDVARCAALAAAQLAASEDPRSCRDALLAWDRELKQAGVNPGTSADLTVATALAGRIASMLEERQTHRSEFADAGFA
jgi:triphosphoribosyl-dephospho-CoA synthase